MPTFKLWRRVTDAERKQIENGELPEGSFQFNDDLNDYQVPKEGIS